MGGLGPQPRLGSHRVTHHSGARAQRECQLFLTQWGHQPPASLEGSLGQVTASMPEPSCLNQPQGAGLTEQ